MRWSLRATRSTRPTRCDGVWGPPDVPGPLGVVLPLGVVCPVGVRSGSVQDVRALADHGRTAQANASRTQLPIMTPSRDAATWPGWQRAARAQAQSQPHQSALAHLQAAEALPGHRTVRHCRTPHAAVTRSLAFQPHPTLRAHDTAPPHRGLQQRQLRPGHQMRHALLPPR